jgi:hypothetical protein
MENDLLKENRSLGFVSLEDNKNIPPHILGRILEIRAAKAAGKPALAPSRLYIAAAEKRGLIALPRSIERKAFPMSVERHRAIFRNIPKGMCVQEHLEVTEMRSFKARVQKQAAVIAATAPKTLSAEEQRELRNERRRIFPWEN